MELDSKDDDGMLLNDKDDIDQFLLDMIEEDDNDYEVAGENRDTMLVERDKTILKTI